MHPHRFELVGGDPALDFLNTLHDWTAADPRDYLPTPADALRFGEAAGLLSKGTSREPARAAARGELTRLRALRSTLERVFRAAVDGRAAAARDLAALSREVAAAAGTARFTFSRGRIRRELDPAAAGSALLRWRIAEAAAVLLTSERLARVKACPACGWFFLDLSKNRSRRWCSMATCGSNAKARRYYWRTRGG